MKPFEQLTEAERADLSRPTGRGMKRDTAILIHKLEPDKLYTASSMAEILYPRGTREHRRVTARMLNFMRHHSVPPDARPNAWYGRNVQDCMDPHYRYLADESLKLVSALRSIAQAKAQTAVAPAPNQEILRPLRHRSRFPLPGFHRRRMLLVAVLSLFVASLATALAVRPSVLEVLDRHGLGAAVAYQLKPQQGMTTKEIYSSAWIDLRQGKIKDAESKAFTLLAKENLDDKLRGDNFFLLGELRAAAGEPGVSASYFSLAYNQYFDLDHQPGLYLASLGMAKAHILMDDFAEGTHFLNQALDHFDLTEPGKVSIDNYELWAIRLHSREGNFHAARLIAEDRLDRLAGSEKLDDLATAYSDLGFWATLDGDCATGFQYSVRAQRLIRELQDPRKELYNSLNFLLLGRCEGKAPDPWLVDRISADVAKEGSTELRQYLDMALHAPISP